MTFSVADIIQIKIKYYHIDKMEKEKSTLKSSAETPQIEVVAVGHGAVGAFQRRNRRNRS